MHPTLRNAALGALLLLASAAIATVVFRWVDDQGKVHYSDVVPERFRGNAKPVDAPANEPTVEQQREATHDLVALWKTFLNVLVESGIDDPNKTDPAVATIVVEFAKVDPNSYSYRYPVDVRGNPIPITGLHGSGPFGMMTVNDKWMAVAISTANPFGIRNVGIKIVEIFMHVLNEVRIMNRPDNRGEQDCDRGDKSQC